MAFEKIEKLSPNRFRGSEAVAYPRLTVSRQKLMGRLIGVVTFNRLLMGTMEWKLGDKLSLSIGTGPDRGWLAIRKTTDGYTVGSFGASNTTACVKAANLFSHITDGSVFSRECKFLVRADTVFAELPTVFVATEANAPATKQVAA